MTTSREAARRDDLAGGLDPVQLRHADVHEYDVGPGGPGPIHGLGPVGGLPHHRDVVFRVEQHLKSGPHQNLIVGEQHFDRSSAGRRSGRRGHSYAVPAGAKGSRALTSNPPHGRGPAVNSPPSSPQRSRIPTIPRPGSAELPLMVPAGGCGLAASSPGASRPPSSVTRTSRTSVP